MVVGSLRLEVAKSRLMYLLLAQGFAQKIDVRNPVVDELQAE